MLCFLMSCQSHKEDKTANNNDTTNSKADSTATAAINDSTANHNEKGESDTLVIDSSQNIVIGFSPSQAEYDAFSKSEKADMDEVLSDFEYYLAVVADTFKPNKIDFTITGARYIKVNNRLFDKKKFKQDVGIIMAKENGKDSVSEGVDSDAGLIPVIRNFYNIK